MVGKCMRRAKITLDGNTVLVKIMLTLMDYCGIIYSPWNVSEL
jgi:hypothetical protein